MDNTFAASYEGAYFNVVKRNKNNLPDTSSDSHNSTFSNSNPQRRLNLFQLQSENQSLSASLDKMNEINSMLSSQIYKLSAERKELISQIDFYSSKVNSLDSDLTQSQKDNDIFKARIAQLTEENVQSKNDIERLMQENREFIKAIDHYKHEVNRQNEEIKGLQCKCEDYADRSSYLISQLEQCRTKVDNDRRDIEKMLHKEKEGKERALNENRDLLRKYEEVLRLRSNKEMSNIKNINKENLKLKQNLDLFSKENHQAAIRIRELESQITHLSNYQKENEALHVMVNDLKEKIDSIQSEINTMRQSNKNKSVSLNQTN